MAGKLARLERGKLRNQSEEAVQGAKDVLAQVCVYMFTCVLVFLSVWMYACCETLVDGGRHLRCV